MPAPRVLSIPRNIDNIPVEGVPMFGELTGVIPNDGALHPLVSTGGETAILAIDAVYQMRIATLRVAWSAVDQTVPPALTLALLANGQATSKLAAFAALMLLPLAGTEPAMELESFASLPGSTITALVRNTGTMPQNVSVSLWGWAYAQSLKDGAGYEWS